jgi:DNA-directed RNA polymerase specialized sigma24 family protein
MVHCYGYRYRDVAEVLGVSDAAVTNHVHRGLARLRTLLGDPS